MSLDVFVANNLDFDESYDPVSDSRVIFNFVKSCHLKNHSHIMKKNMGNFDRIVRVLIAVVVLVLYAANYLTGTWAVVLLILSIIFLLTSILGFCPLYVPFKLRTCKKQPGEK